MTEYERVREQVKRILTKFEGTAFYPYSSSVVGALSRELLSLVEIRADDQSLPEWCRVSIDSPSRCVQKMLNANFIKVINKEEG